MSYCNSSIFFFFCFPDHCSASFRATDSFCCSWCEEVTNWLCKSLSMYCQLLLFQFRKTSAIMLICYWDVWTYAYPFFQKRMHSKYCKSSLPQHVDCNSIFVQTYMLEFTECARLSSSQNTISLPMTWRKRIKKKKKSSWYLLCYITSGVK